MLIFSSENSFLFAHITREPCEPLRRPVTKGLETPRAGWTSNDQDIK